LAAAARTDARGPTDRSLAGWVCHRGRTSPWLEAIAGIRQRSSPRLGSKPVRAGSPDPLRGTCKSIRRSGFHLRDRNKQAPPPPSERQKRCAGQSVRGYFPSGSAVSSIGGQYLGVLFLGNLGNPVLGIFGIVPVHAGQSVVRAGQSVQGVSLVEPCYFAQVGTILPLVAPAAAAAATGQPQQQQQRSTARTERARSKLVVPRRRRRSAHQVRGRSREHAVLHVQDQLVANSAVQ
jgi:hypothetical protein